jgi:hypothetical protein
LVSSRSAQREATVNEFPVLGAGVTASHDTVQTFEDLSMKATLLRWMPWVLPALCLGLMATPAKAQQAGDCEPRGDYGNNCNPCYATCCPLWTLRATGVYMTRQDPDSRTFVTQPNGTDALNFDQFNFDYEPGADVSLIRSFGCGSGIEGRYLGLWNFEDTVNVGPFPGGAVIFNTNPPSPGAFPPAGATINARYESELHSGELNYRYCSRSWLTLLGGVRYLQLDEEFGAQFLSVDPTIVGPLTINSEALNDLYGAQLGADINLFESRDGNLRVSGIGKTGLYYAHSENRQSVASFNAAGAPVFAVASRDVDDRVALVAEAGGQVSYKITGNVAVVVGYQVLFLQDVALASDQIAAGGNIAAPSARLDTNGDVLFHGANAGLMFGF